jgi:diaminopimelate epimerase
VLTGRLKRKVTALFDKGELKIEWRESNGRLYMTGPATHVFSGTYEYTRV